MSWRRRPTGCMRLCSASILFWHIARSGQVAWYSATLDDVGEWDGKPVGARDIRWTGVLEKREGKWVMVQQHGSLARDKVLELASQKKDAETQ
jgi:hypothetical protein